MIWTLRIALLLLRVMMRLDDKTDVPGIVFLKNPTQMRTDTRTFVRERARDQHLLGKGRNQDWMEGGAGLRCSHDEASACKEFQS